MAKITGFETFDVRFPTSKMLDGSDAMNQDPDYSGAYLRINTDSGIHGDSLIFTIGRGNEVQIKALDILQHNRSVRDQSKLDSDSRSINIAGAFSAKLSGLPAAGNIEPLIVVDDLITTGATLAEGIRALRTAGFTVLGAVTGSVAKPLR